MDDEDKQVLLTTAWLFMQHGLPWKAKAICREVNDADPADGACAALLAQLLLDNGEAPEALAIIQGAAFPPEMARVAALMESRALRESGKPEEGDAVWARYLASKNKQRRWVVEQ